MAQITDLLNRTSISDLPLEQLLDDMANLAQLTWFRQFKKRNGSLNTSII